METTTEAANAGLTHWVLEFKYDVMGRRVQKRSNNVTAGTDVYTRYVYDGWNVVAEFGAPSGSSIGTLLRSFTWGVDCSGSMTASGGIGALLQIVDHANGKTYFPTYDGNGNVVTLIDAGDGAVAIAYEYSPFGELLRAEVNPSLAANVRNYLAVQPFRFSTKWADAESGLSYYGLRYYSPALGRFINRDPIEEQGGINLYAFASNDPMSRWDYLGLDAPPIVLPEVVATGDGCMWEPTTGRFTCLRTGGGGGGWPNSTTLYQHTFTQWTLFAVYTNVGVAGGTFTRPSFPNVQTAPNKTGKQAPLDLLKKLCGTEAGRALVDALRNGSRSVREVSSGLLSPGLQTATSMTAGTSNEAAGTIYLFPGNYANLANTLANSRFNYRGSAADFGASTLIHENLHFNNPAPPGTVPAGQAGRFEEALVRQLTDRALPSYNLPQVFGLPDRFRDYLGTVPNQGTDLRTGKPTSDYGQPANNSIISQLDAASSELSGWDCSRVK